MTAVEHLLFLPYEVPSANTRDKQHWAVRNRETGRLTALARLLRYKLGVPSCGHVRKAVGIVAYRRRRIADHANLCAGAKGLVDALVKAEWLHDDSDRWATFTYAQDVLSAVKDWPHGCPEGRPFVRITITEATP